MTQQPAQPTPSGQVVVGYDGSPDAGRALDVAAALFEAPLLVVHIWSTQSPESASFVTGGAALAAPPVTAPARLEPRARALLDEAVQRVAVTGRQAEPLLVAGDVATGGIWRTLLSIADERDAVAVVVGRHGLSRLANALLGSVSNGLVQHATRPVLVVPPA